MDNGMNPPPATNLPIIKAEIDDGAINDDSKWRDIDIFLPFDDLAQIEQIQILFRVSRNTTETNYTNFECNHKAGEGKCKYRIRWRKADGMVQSRGKHGHKKFVELKWKKCRECTFECANNAIMSNHYLQNHNDKPFRHCPRCSATFENANHLHWHIQGTHSDKNNGDLADLQRRLDLIIEEWEEQQRMMNHQQMESTSNSTIGRLFNGHQQYSAQNINNSFHHPQPNSVIPSTNEMPATPCLLTNWPHQRNGKLEQNIHY